MNPAIPKTTKEGTTIIGLPLVESLLDQNPEFDSYSIPAGFYGVHPAITLPRTSSGIDVYGSIAKLD